MGSFDQVYSKRRTLPPGFRTRLISMSAASCRSLGRIQDRNDAIPASNGLSPNDVRQISISKRGTERPRLARRFSARASMAGDRSMPVTSALGG
ncbi:MAG: hypothetical protein A3G73_09770 [Rhodospirillales bacterium RIFCSPLOWO2_12_FULL_67_15]|nr:MAG: hypothetical protein A3G73_09770 [Rhodospirillales bacterium RIFCSPLOWO2_12_FULL_67_15]